MIEPHNDEERKTLRLLEAYRRRAGLGMSGHFVDDNQKDYMLAVLAEARAIFREEQAAKSDNPRSSAKEDELRAVRDEIRLRSEVLRAFPEPPLSQGEADEQEMQSARFMELLRRERELMGDSWVTG